MLNMNELLSEFFMYLDQIFNKKANTQINADESNGDCDNNVIRLSFSTKVKGKIIL